MSNSKTLGASHLASAGWEIQRKNNFILSIPGVGESEQLLTLAVVSCALPTESNEVITLNYNNTNVKVAGPANTEGGSLVVRDYLQKDMELVLDNWRKEVWNKDTDAIGFAANYKRQARVIQYAPDGSYERTWKIEGLWPSSIAYGDLSNDDGGVKTINVTLQYDKARLSRA